MSTSESQLPEDARGILPSQWIENALAKEIIRAERPVERGQIQPNSLDLRVSARAWRVQCSFMPGSQTVRTKLDRYRWYTVTDEPDEGMVLEPDQIYVFELEEELALPPEISARANPKSSTGRLDVFCRVVCDYAEQFDEVPAGYRGKLFLEVVPRSFPIRLRTGDSLAQIRFAAGDAEMTDDDVRAALEEEPIVVGDDGKVMTAADLKIDRGLYLSVRMSGEEGQVIGFRARKNTPPIDLRAVGQVPVFRYWEHIAFREGDPIILEPDEFYIFSSRELVRLPPNICAEMVPFDAGSGEVRTHYAGFFDSGFGYMPGKDPAETASAVVLEVRNRDVPFLLEHGQPLFRLVLLHNQAQPRRLYGQSLSSNYQGQRLRLSKQFRLDDSDR